MSFTCHIYADPNNDLRMKPACLVKPFESEGVVERTEVNMLTSTLVVIKMIWVKIKIKMIKTSNVVRSMPRRAG